MISKNFMTTNKERKQSCQLGMEKGPHKELRQQWPESRLRRSFVTKGDRFSSLCYDIIDEYKPSMISFTRVVGDNEASSARLFGIIIL